MLVAEPLPKQALDSAVNPTKIVQQTFDLERRGFDQRQVQAYLRAVADSLRDAQSRESEMRTRLGKAIRRAETAEQGLRDAPSDDPSQLTRQIGDEVTSVLDAARAAGEQRVTAAEKSAARLMANAKEEATQIRGAAETIMDERRAEAEEAAAELMAHAQAQADSLLEQARGQAESVRSDAANHVARARDECDGLIREAEEARMQILEDMDRRRRQARAQVERLRVGRDRLLRSYDVVRRTLEETTGELKSSLQEAKVRGDTAARLVAGEPLASRGQLEAELADAKLIGRVKTTDPAVLRSPALPRPIDPPMVPNIDLRTSGLVSDSAPKPRRPQVPDAKPTSVGSSPRPPAAVPDLKPEPVEAEAEEVEVEAAAAVTSPETQADPEQLAQEQPELEQPELEQPLESAAESDAEVEVWVAAESAVPASDDTPSLPEIEELAAEPVDDELAQLEDANLTIIEPGDDIEEVVAVEVMTSELEEIHNDEEPVVDPSIDEDLEPAVDVVVSDVAEPIVEVSLDQTGSTPPNDEPAVAARPSLFAALREQQETEQQETAREESVLETDPAAADPGVELDRRVELDPSVDADVDADRVIDLTLQRDAIITEAASQLERRLKRALADEQNDLLAGIRAAKSKPVELTPLVGDPDAQLRRYVMAINEVAAVAYGAGAALVDAEAREAHLPAGAVEELLTADVVSPIRERLTELDALGLESSDGHVDSVRAFYRQRKTDYLGPAAAGLARLLCVAGACDAMPADTALPWALAESNETR